MEFNKCFINCIFIIINKTEWITTYRRMHICSDIFMYMYTNVSILVSMLLDKLCLINVGLDKSEEAVKIPFSLILTLYRK